MNNFEAALWWGLIAPKGTPPERVKILDEAFRKAKDSPKFKETLAKLGATDERPGQQEFTKHIRDEYEVNAKVVQQLGLPSKK